MLEAGGSAGLTPPAIPTVTVVDDLVILDHSSDGAAKELGIWGTSSGSTALNAIAGMVYENVPEASAIEHRLDGSCAAFTERMQGGGCPWDTRERWEQYKASPS